MNRNYIYRNSTEALPDLLYKIMDEGVEVGSRAGRTKEFTHLGITLTHPWERELLVPARKPNLAAQIAETMWILAGRNDIGWLGHYLPRAKDFSDDGQTWRSGYGPRLRSYGGIDQLAYVVRTLQEHANSRQAVINLWDPHVDTTPGKDIACNDWLVFSNRLGRLDLQVGIRSNDAIWGWSGINAFEWSVLQEIVAVLCGVGVGSLHFSVGSWHVYEQHWERARRIAVERGVERAAAKASPGFRPNKRTVEYIDGLIDEWFNAESAIRNESALAEAYVDQFPEPMMRSWLRVLQWYWHKDAAGAYVYLDQIANTRLAQATQFSLTPPLHTEYAPATVAMSDFVDFVAKLHEEKNAAYGDSWKRRGEMLGILANIARKVDRLEVGGETTDESQADTAIDLLVYLAKYRFWLAEHYGLGTPYLIDSTGEPERIRALLEELNVECDGHRLEDAAQGIKWVTDDFANLEQHVADKRPNITQGVVDRMLPTAFLLAKQLWSQ